MKPPPQAEPLAVLAARTFDRIAEPIALIERVLHDQVASDVQLIGAVGDHVLSAGGKRLRPALVLLAAELCGYTGPRRLQIGAAVELLHTATLLHDDVVDLSSLRRGRPSANAVWGNRRAVLAGDFLYARASAMMAEDGDPHLIEIFAATIGRMAEGELLQLEGSFDLDITEANYFDVIDRKSAALLAAACEAGAILGGVTRAERRRLAAFGRDLGLAFQLKDDALDYDTQAATLGKRQYADLHEGKVTLPLLLTLKRCSSSEREEIAGLLKAAARRSEENPSADDIDFSPVAELVAAHHGVEDTLRRAADHIDRCQEALAAFPEGEAREALLGAATFAVARDR
ncbi:MAG: hypothetical protein CBC48_01835 [bacterium TMED88]|nr:octaprenyl diphosphate synthase [Deltaproteobacteria bacterium]OUV36734.1 MAG: hypothetical protein CBC48_01835 [bacterium TMED88]